MTHIISVHSFRRGTGKSTLAANLAALLALGGWRVGVLDTNLQSPSQHILFGLPEHEIQHTLNDYVWGRTGIRPAAYNVTQSVGMSLATRGQVWLVPASTHLQEIGRALREDFDARRLDAGFRQLADDLELDVLLADTHAGVSDATLTTIAFSSTLVLNLRPDYQDYQGTGLIVELARKLGVPRTRLILNEVLPVFDFVELKAQAEKNYRCPVAAVLPHDDDWSALGSAGLFAVRFSDHPLTHELKRVAAELMA
jgi:MinD-like ATPase involved in chromosome partitioning or flagellar assembly